MARAGTGKADSDFSCRQAGSQCLNWDKGSPGAIRLKGWLASKSTARSLADLQWALHLKSVALGNKDTVLLGEPDCIQAQNGCFSFFLFRVKNHSVIGLLLHS